jgi:myo-inositol-1-phosphate synthase
MDVHDYEAPARTSGHTIVEVHAPNVSYNEGHILSKYVYENAKARKVGGRVVVQPTKVEYEFKTETSVPRVGLSPSIRELMAG